MPTLKKLIIFKKNKSQYQYGLFYISFVENFGLLDGI